MFIIFLSILVLNVSVSRPTENKNVPFRDKFRRSLTHLKNMLFTIEDKIKIEKKKLSQIIYDMNRKKNIDAARTDTTVKPYFEDIMPKDLYNINSIEITPVAPAVSFTFATMFPSPPVNSYWTPTEMTDTSVITNFPVYAEPTKLHTTTQSPFMQDMEKTMKEDKHNYFTAFLTRFTELIAIKKTHDTKLVLNQLLIKLNEKLDALPFDEEEGKRLTKILKMYFPMMSAMPPDKLKEQAMYAHFALKNKATMMSVEDNKITDFYGNYFNKADGEELFKALETFYEYNNGKHTAAEVVDMIVRAALKPYLRVKETGVDTTASTVSETIESTVHETQYPTQVTKYPVHITQYSVHATKYPVTATQYQVPSWRRNMNLKQNVKRILLKNPKLLEKIKEHYKIDSKKLHHSRFSIWKFDQNFHKNHDRQSVEHEQTKQKAYTSSNKVYNYPKNFQDVLVKNHILHKIREAPSYSDEEEHLKTNLYDALRHDNMTFSSFRKSGNDVISNQPVQDLSSEPDDEWVLKNNIYKVLEPKLYHLP